MSTAPAEIFISYSHKDEELLERLDVHLNVLKRQGIVTVWHGREIVPGVDWEKEIDKHLNTAQIILLLVSANFIASDYCYGVEFKRALERNEQETARVIPVILSPSNWRETPLGKLHALPKGGTPVVKWANIDDAFVSVIEGIKEAVTTLRPTVLSRPPAIPSVTTIEITLDDSLDRFDKERFAEALRDQVLVDLKRITISVRSGSVKISIEGDPKELVPILEALFDSEIRGRVFGAAKLKSITYIQDHNTHSVPLEPPAPEKDDDWNSPKGILRQAIQAVPAVKYALGVAGMAAAVAIVAGFSVDYKVAVLGTIIMFGLMFGLVAFSSIAFNSTAALRPLALFLAWTFVLLIAATSLCIFTSFFFDRPRPLGEYVRHMSGPSPTPVSTPLPSPTIETTPGSTPIRQPISILITTVPPYDAVGDRTSQASIAGKVLGAIPQDYRIVIYSLTKKTWYVQPKTANPMTPIRPDGSWSVDIHTGARYAILLVHPDFPPPDTTSDSPTSLSGVVTSEEIEGKK